MRTIRTPHHTTSPSHTIKVWPCEGVLHLAVAMYIETPICLVCTTASALCTLEQPRWPRRRQPNTRTAAIMHTGSAMLTNPNYRTGGDSSAASPNKRQAQQHTQVHCLGRSKPTHHEPHKQYNAPSQKFAGAAACSTMHATTGCL